MFKGNLLKFLFLALFVGTWYTICVMGCNNPKSNKKSLSESKFEKTLSPDSLLVGGQKIKEIHFEIGNDDSSKITFHFSEGSPVVWTNEPLFSICYMTKVYRDGRKYESFVPLIDCINVEGSGPLSTLITGSPEDLSSFESKFLMLDEVMKTNDVHPVELKDGSIKVPLIIHAFLKN